MGLWLNKVIVSSTSSSKRQGSYRCTFILEIKSRRTNCNFHWKYLSWSKRSLHFPGHRLRGRYLAGFSPQAGYSGQWKRSTKVTKWNPSFNRFHSNENERGFYRQGYVTVSLCQKFSFQAVLFFKERWPILFGFRGDHWSRQPSHAQLTSAPPNARLYGRDVLCIWQVSFWSSLVRVVTV